jgi:hypothetical protein
MIQEVLSFIEEESEKIGEQKKKVNKISLCIKYLSDLEFYE